MGLGDPGDEDDPYVINEVVVRSAPEDGFYSQDTERYGFNGSYESWLDEQGYPADMSHSNAVEMYESTYRADHNAYVEKMDGLASEEKARGKLWMFARWFDFIATVTGLGQGNAGIAKGGVRGKTRASNSKSSKSKSRRSKSNLEASQALSGKGDLTVAEAQKIQAIANRAGRPIHVVGSAAKGARGPGSDIDYIVTPSNSAYFDAGLAKQLPGIDSHGILFGHPNTFQGPVITFSPL